MDRDDRLSRLADDLELVRSAVNRNSTVLREVMGPMHYRGLLAYAGAACIALCLAFHFVPRPYGGFAASPAWVRAMLVGATIAAVIGGGAAKLLSLRKAARSVDERLTVLTFFRRYYGPMVAHLYPPLILTLLGVAAWLLATGGASFFVPGLTAALWFALVFGLGCLVFVAAATVTAWRR